MTIAYLMKRCEDLERERDEARDMVQRYHSGTVWHQTEFSDYLQAENALLREALKVACENCMHRSNCDNGCEVYQASDAPITAAYVERVKRLERIEAAVAAANPSDGDGSCYWCGQSVNKVWNEEAFAWERHVEDHLPDCVYRVALAEERDDAS